MESSHPSRPCGVAASAVALVLLAASATAQTWFHKQEADELTIGPVAHDASRGRTVMFNGWGQTWEWDGAAWSQRWPDHSPPRRLGSHRMVCDTARGRVVLFGGAVRVNSVTTYLDETWEWDGVDWTLETPVASPVPRALHGMAYDGARRRTLVFGGYDGSQVLADTWEWDGTTWTRQSPASSPPARSNHLLASDDSRQRVVLHGGNDDVPRYFSDTWEWDGADWSQRVTSPVPPARSRSAMAYDATRQRVLLFGGGVAGRNQFLSDTWEWDGINWSQRVVQTSPSARETHVMTFDATRQRVLLLGGHPLVDTYRTTGDLTDLWEWDGTSWTRLLAEQGQPFRIGCDLAYDSARRRAVMFGGSLGGSTGYLLNDTWEWDGSVWQRRAPTAIPPTRDAHAMAYDAARARVVLFGGHGGGGVPRNDTWEWDGNIWTQRSPSNSPAARWAHAMEYDGARQRVVLFGGYDSRQLLNDTWEFDGTTWTQRITAQPRRRGFHAMAYDVTRQRIVLFGGEDRQGASQRVYLSDTWEWDGNVWRLATSQGPQARTNHELSFDGVRGRVLLVGGQGPNGVFDDTWEWDGSTWAQWPWSFHAAGANSTSWIRMAHDGARGQVVLLMGGQTWLSGLVQPAISTTSGAGCAGMNSAPRIAPFGRPWIGNPRFGVDVDSLLPSTPAAVFLGPPSSPISIGGGCTLYINPSTVFAGPLLQSNSSGFAHLDLPIPVNRALIGARLSAQAASLDPSSPVGGIVLSGLLALQLGD